MTRTTNPSLAAGQLTELKGRITHRKIPILFYKPELARSYDEFEKILIVELAQDTGNRRRYADSIWYVQATTSAIASHGERLARPDAGGRLPLRLPRHRERP